MRGGFATAHHSLRFAFFPPLVRPNQNPICREPKEVPSILIFVDMLNLPRDVEFGQIWTDSNIDLDRFGQIRTDLDDRTAWEAPGGPSDGAGGSTGEAPDGPFDGATRCRV